MSATLTKPSASNVNRTSAIINYSASGYKTPDDSTGEWNGAEPSSGNTWTQTRKVISYSDIAYSWSFGSSRQSGSHTFTNLKVGSAVQISATLTVTCSKKETTQTRKKTRQWIEGTPAQGTPGQEGYKPAVPGKWGSWSAWGTVTNSSSSSTKYTIASNVKAGPITVYTKPSEFNWGSGVAKDQIIQDSNGLSASKWNNLVTKVEQYANWKNQNSGANYNNATVSSEEIISARKYNILASSLGVSGVSSKDLITASVFIALQNAINR